MTNLSTKYRPTKFQDVCSQTAIVKILEKQIETKQFKNAFLFSGASGCGKTTIARIFANEINNGIGEPIEIDAASNNGVDNVRNIIDSAAQRSIDCKYKVFIIDEAHMLTTQAWNALLKTIEETPEYTIFMFCTTEYHKIPVTIQNRCQQYFLTRIPDSDIISRLKMICSKESIVATDEALTHITKLAQGGMRQAISYLDKCKDFSMNLTIKEVMEVLGDFSYDTMFTLMNSIIDKDQQKTIKTIEKLHNDGSDLKTFLEMFIEFVMDLDKYTLFKSTDIIKIPESFKNQIQYTTNVEEPTKYYNHILNKLIDVKLASKNDTNLKTTLEILLTQL